MSNLLDDDYSQSLRVANKIAINLFDTFLNSKCSCSASECLIDSLPKKTRGIQTSRGRYSRLHCAVESGLPIKLPSASCPERYTWNKHRISISHINIAIVEEERYCATLRMEI